ncbi:MAG TPA: hypothetical protein VK809_04460 [Bacteroidia bacterium]|nr:hypothetical protein [Bacteroidia bacterium]
MTTQRVAELAFIKIGMSDIVCLTLPSGKVSRLGNSHSWYFAMF